jgi:DNA-binding transcriptional regulator YiaG
VTEKVLDLYNIVIYSELMKQWTHHEIESFRKNYKLTRRSFGELLGVTVSTIYQWERGIRKPSTTAKILLSRIEKEFECERR